MKNKKIIMYIKIILFILIIIAIGYFIYKNISFEKNVMEYTPQSEITDEQMRQTIIRLYYYNPTINNLAYEDRIIDSKKLLNNPYEYILNLLLNEPITEELVKIIPENVKINKVELLNGILYIDFSEDFIEEQNLGIEQEKLIINSIVNTLTELNEVNKVKININGNENAGYPGNGVVFNDYFFRDFAN